MDDVEYRPQRGVGTRALVNACVAVAMTALLLSAANIDRAYLYLAAFPAAWAVAWLAAYVVRRRLRCRLTAAGIETRRVRTRFIPWAEIREVQVTKRVTVARVAVRGNRASGRFGSRSGGGARKVAAVRVQQANGRWLELAMPVVWENAHDSDFTTKAAAIKNRWQAAIGQMSAERR